MARLVLFGVLQFLALCVSVGAQRELFRWTGAPGESFGRVVLGPGDLDADGYPDVLVSAPSADNGAGRVYVYAGRTGVLRQSLTSAGTSGFGSSVQAARDLDLDGCPDFWVSHSSGLIACSGRTLAVIRSLALPQPIDDWRSDGDGDGDGMPDVLIADAAGVVARSGRDLREMIRIPLSCCSYPRWVPDVDGDGKWDILISFVQISSPYVQILSSVDGRVLREYRDTAGQDVHSAGAIGDMNRDGWLDYYLYQGMRGTGTYRDDRGIVDIYSSRDGARISTWTGMYGLCDPRRYCPPTSSIVAPTGIGTLDGTGAACVLLGQIIRRFEDETEILTLPRAGTLVGDVDRDGVGDIAYVNSGTVSVVALQPHLRQGTFFFPDRISGLGDRWVLMDTLDDIDGDGMTDYGVAWAQWRNYVYSAACSIPGVTLVATMNAGVSGSPSCSLGNAGDVNGDGRPDVAVTWWNPYGRPQSSQGGVYDWRGNQIFPFVSSDMTHGKWVGGGVDWNRDGRDDVVVASAAVTRVISGRDQSLLHTWSFSGRIARLGDLNRDGVRDLAIGDTVFATGSGAALFTRPGVLTFRDAGDLTGDGVPDLWASAVDGVHLHDGRSGSVVRSVPWSPGVAPGSIDTGDWDGDGVRDLALGLLDRSLVVVRSGRTDAILFQYSGRSTADQFGAGISMVTGNLFSGPRLVVAAIDGGPQQTGYTMTLGESRYPPGAAEFGTACGATLGLPGLHWVGGRPALGSTRTVRLTTDRAGPGAIWMGSETEWSGVPLPTSLGFLGAPACMLLASTTAVAPLPVTSRSNDLPIRIPLDIYILGSRYALQGGSLAANPADWALSNGVRIRLSL